MPNPNHPIPEALSHIGAQRPEDEIESAVAEVCSDEMARINNPVDEDHGQRRLRWLHFAHIATILVRRQLEAQQGPARGCRRPLLSHSSNIS